MSIPWNTDSITDDFELWLCKRFDSRQYWKNTDEVLSILALTVLVLLIHIIINSYCKVSIRETLWSVGSLLKLSGFRYWEKMNTLHLRILLTAQNDKRLSKFSSIGKSRKSQDETIPPSADMFTMSYEKWAMIWSQWVMRCEPW